MSEKATLLSSIPPVKKAGQDTASKGKLLSPTREIEKSTLGAGNQLEGSETVETVEAVVASEGVASDAESITAFQFATYAVFVLNFILAGAMAILLFKKASKLLEERFAVSTKALAITCVLILLHGIFATYLFNSYLNGEVSSAPLFVTMAGWVLIGAMVGFISRHLLARQDKANTKGAYTDACVYAFIFILVACGVSTSIKTNAAMVSSILAGFLMIVPIARSMTAFKVAKARHKELNETSDKILVYGLLVLPALLPVVSFAFVCGLSETATLFLINFITFDFVLVVGLAMIASANVLTAESQEEAADAEAATPAAKQAPKPKKAASRRQSAAAEPAPKVAAGNPEDPIIQFLNSEDGAGEEPASATQEKPASKTAPRKLPPRKPSASGLTPPKKPGAGKRSAPNAPSGMKAPSKPKKRF